jgi:phosphate-selective porin OprO/OprP
VGRITFNILVAAASTIIAVTVNAQTIEQLPSRTATTQPFLFGSETINSAVESALSLSPTSTIRQEEEEDPNDFRVFWNNGLRMETNDGRFQVRLGGRTMYDWTFWGDGSEVEDSVGSLLNGTEFRRARLFVQGYLYERIEFKAQYDFAGGKIVAKDLYLGIRHAKHGFRVGHMKEPSGLEILTSSKYITFVERSLPTLFDAERNSGFLLHGDVIDGRFNYGIGVFRETNDKLIGDLPGRYNVTGRFAGALLNRDNRVFHAGASFSFQNGDGAWRSFKARPEVHLSPRFISSAIPTNAAIIVGLETAVLAGPFSVQGEWKMASFDSLYPGDPVFSGWYGYASWFLTGEIRNYSASGFGRTSPKRNFLDGSSGTGAFELAARYSTLDLSLDGVGSLLRQRPGTQLDNLTVALNWYVNPLVVVKHNFIHANIEDIGKTLAFLWRAQVEF